MKLIERMERDFYKHDAPRNANESNWLAGFRAAREMAAQTLNDRGEAHYRRSLTMPDPNSTLIARASAVEANAGASEIRQLGEAEEGQ